MNRIKAKMKKNNKCNYKIKIKMNRILNNNRLNKEAYKISNNYKKIVKLNKIKMKTNKNSNNNNLKNK